MIGYTLQWRASPNFTAASRSQAVYGRPRTIQFGAGHWWNLPSLAGTHAGIVALFQNPARQGSAHAVLSDRLVTEMVRAADIAWTTSHANPFTYSIEVDPRIMYKWGYDNPSAAQRAHGERIFQTLAEYIADKGYHNLTWHPHNYWISTQCNPIRWNEVMARAKQIHAAKNAPKPPTTPPATNAKLTWSKLAKPVEMVATKQPTKLWNFNQTTWAGFGNGVKDFNKGDRITIFGKVVNETLKATYLLTEYSYNAKITNGFNQADLEPYTPPPPPSPEWVRNIKNIEPVKLMVLATSAPIFNLEDVSKTVGTPIPQGTWIDFVKQTTVAGKVYLISKYSSDNAMSNGILKDHVGIPVTQPDPEPEPEPEWLKNWEDIEDVVMYARGEIEVVNLTDGSTVTTIKKGTAVDVASATEVAGGRYFITKWATDQKAPHGIRIVDLSMNPVDETEEPIIEDPLQPVDDLIRENNSLLKQILALLQKVWNIITGKG